MSAQDFLATLESLSEKAEKGPYFVDTDLSSPYYALRALLANNRKAIAELVRAAERTCVKLGLHDEHELRETLAALKGEQP